MFPGRLKSGPTLAGMCGCGKALGPIEIAIATDQGILERRTCTGCNKVQYVPKNETT